MFHFYFVKFVNFRVDRNMSAPLTVYKGNVYMAELLVLEIDTFVL